jgi:hypothetical protein
MDRQAGRQENYPQAQVVFDRYGHIQELLTESEESSHSQLTAEASHLRKIFTAGCLEKSIPRGLELMPPRPAMEQSLQLLHSLGGLCCRAALLGRARRIIFSPAFSIPPSLGWARRFDC